MKPLIKWPGGKGRLIKHLSPLVPKHDRYIEPFLGGGALFFSLEPESSEVNDLSKELVDFYLMIKTGNEEFFSLVDSISRLFTLLGDAVRAGDETCSSGIADFAVNKLISEGFTAHKSRIFDPIFLSSHINKAMTTSKRLSTAAHSGLYYAVRDEYNSGRFIEAKDPYKSSLFFLIRELCFGSMFRYNSSNEFNIPYGGFSYDRKDLSAKAGKLRMASQSSFFRRVGITCSDFRGFLVNTAVLPGDFIFLDPPYDSEFSGYSGNAFGRREQEDLRDILSMIGAKFLLVVERTDFIEDLYKPLGLDCRTLPSLYSYSIRGRNDRAVDYLIMKNY